MSEKDSLVGYEVVLNPRQSGMYIDPVNNFTLSFFENGKDRIKITEEMDLTFIKRAIKYGTLFVYKGDKNVSAKFGGKDMTSWRFTPIVKKSEPTDGDEYYLKILGKTDENKVVQDIRSITDFAVLKRLEELEKAGKNPVVTCRDAVIDEIHRAMKKTTGMSAPQKDEKEDEIVNLK